jgi:hypothetical protein
MPPIDYILIPIRHNSSSSSSSSSSDVIKIKNKKGNVP